MPVARIKRSSPNQTRRGVGRLEKEMNQLRFEVIGDEAPESTIHLDRRVFRELRLFATNSWIVSSDDASSTAVTLAASGVLPPLLPLLFVVEAFLSFSPELSACRFRHSSLVCPFFLQYSHFSFFLGFEVDEDVFLLFEVEEPEVDEFFGCEPFVDV